MVSIDLHRMTSRNLEFTVTYFFYVLLTVFLVNNQPDAQFFFCIYLFRFSTCFEHHCAHHQEDQLHQYNTLYMSLCIDRLVCRCTLDGHLHRVTHQILYWYNWFSWWWAQWCSKHVENWNKYIQKKNCASGWLFTKIVTYLVGELNYFYTKLIKYHLCCCSVPQLRHDMIDQKEGETELSVKVHYDDMVSVIIAWFFHNICILAVPETFSKTPSWTCSLNFLKDTFMNMYLELSQGHLHELVPETSSRTPSWTCTLNFLTDTFMNLYFKLSQGHLHEHVP